MKLIKGNEKIKPEKKTVSESKMTLMPPSLSKDYNDKIIMSALLRAMADKEKMS